MASAADLLKCSLCLSEFKDPRALPCLHTFCLKCLIDLADTTEQVDTMKCPVCQEHHKMPQNGAGGFRKDFRINSFIEINNNVERSVRRTMCKRHPKMELTHFCGEIDCNRTVLCSQCVAQSHRNHLVHPVKSICEEKLGQLRMMKQAAQQNRELLTCAQRSFEKNTFETFYEIKARIKEFHAQLDQLEKKIADDAGDKAFIQCMSISRCGDELKDIESLLERLEAEFSDTVPNIVKANADKHLDRDFQRLQESLSTWNLSYSLLQVDDILQTAVEFTLPMNNSFVKIMPRQDVKGASVDFLRRTVQLVKAEEMVTWQQWDDDVRGVGCHSYGGGGVTILSTSHLRVYKQNEGKMFHSNTHDDEAYRVTTFRERCHAVLNQNPDEVRLFYSWPIFLDKNDHRIRIRGEGGCGISGTDNYLVYSAWRKPTKSQIVCFSVTKDPSEFLWYRNFGPITPRSLSALESQKELLVVVAAESCHRKKATALIAVNGPSKPLWKITFESLDREAEEFDLRDMCNDGRYFYVLNTEEGCVHVISTDGVVLSKILHRLDTPRSLACNSERKELVVACRGGAVKVYRLIYKDLS